MISFDEAAAIVAVLAKPVGTETVALDQAHGRVLAAPVTAAIDAPSRNVSAMDGYAVREGELAQPPVRLPVVGTSYPDTPDPAPLSPGTCVRIFTGAPLPPGADRVVIQENVTREGDVALFTQPLSKGRHWRAAGSDFTAGTELLAPGCVLGPRALVVAAGADRAAVSCWRKPRVAVLATGDELVAPGEAAGRPGSIPESGAAGAAALVAEHGGIVVLRRTLADNREGMAEAARAALEQADLVIIIGGASVGEKDFARAAFADHGLREHFTKVSIKPGKPVWLGQCGATLVMGLPGNPTSAMVTARLLLAPLVAGLAGRDPAGCWDWREVTLATPLAGGDDRENFVRARLADGAAQPLSNQDSGAQATLAAADLLLRVTPNAPARAGGDRVTALAF